MRLLIHAVHSPLEDVAHVAIESLDGPAKHAKRRMELLNTAASYAKNEHIVTTAATWRWLLRRAFFTTRHHAARSESFGKYHPINPPLYILFEYMEPC